MATAKREKRFWTCDTVRVILLQVVCVSSLLARAGGSNVSCLSELSGGDCTTTRPSQPNCTADSDNDCRRNTGDPAALYNPGYVDNPLSQQCQSYRSSSPSPTHTVARALTTILYPVGSDKKYSLYVSWQTSNEDTNIEGFYVWYYKCSRGACFYQNETYIDLPLFDRGHFECLPIHSANARSVLFNGMKHRSTILKCQDGRLYDGARCNSQAVMTVVVVPRPLPASVTFSQLLETSSLNMAWENLDRCWATVFNANCLSPVFIKPVADFNVTTTKMSGELMNIHVVWSLAPGDVDYIVTITDPLISVVPNCTTPANNPPCFVARNTTQVMISMLNITKEYSISVQVVPRCNDSSFAEHFVGCHSEECCRAKRVSHVMSGDHSKLPSPSLTSNDIKKTTLHIGTTGVFYKRSSSDGPESQHVSTQSSHGTNSAGTTRDMQRYVRPSTTTNTPVLSLLIPSFPSSPSLYGVSMALGTNTPIDGVQHKADVGGSRRAVIGASVSIFVVALFIACAVSIITFYFARRKIKYHSATNSLTSASSLLESLESSDGGGGARDGGEYCNMFTIDHIGEPPTYTVTTAGVEGSDKVPVSPASSSESPDLQTSFETESFTEESQLSTCSDSEIFIGSSVSMEDDAFEKTADKSRESDADNIKTDVSINTQQVTTDKTLDRRNRSESVRVKTSRTSSSSSSRRRPRSLSTSHVTPPHSHPPPPPSALILYSKSSPEIEQRVIQQCLVSDLTHFNIRTVSEDTCTSRECPASWLEAQMREVSAVFCVCNEAFDREWENKTDGLSGLVPVFKQLCHGLVTPSCGRNQLLLDKIAIVLPRESDLQFVPTYINSRPKFRLLVQDLEKMVRFVTGTPQYQCSSDS